MAVGFFPAEKWTTHQLQMCRVSQLSLKLPLYSMLILIILLTLWFVTSYDLYKFNAAFVKDPIKSGASEDGEDIWQEHGQTGSINYPSLHVNNAIRISYKKHMRINNSVKTFLNKYSTSGEYGRFRHKDIEQNAKSDISGTDLMDFTETKFHWDPTKNPAISRNKRTFPLLNARKMKLTRTHNSSLRATLSTLRSSISSKQSLDVSIYVAKNSVYGESGCPDNPRREDLLDLLRTWIRISKQNNIEYVLAYGSLLGTMRDGDVIPYDSDIDILVDVNYFSIIKRLSVERNFNSSDGKIRLVVQPEFTLNIPVEVRKRLDCRGQETPYMIDPCSFQEPMARLIKGKLCIDFFHFYDRSHTVEDPCEDRLKQYHKNDFYPFRNCTFMGLQVTCPNNPWEVLRIYFNTDDLQPIYKCKNGTWVDKYGLAVDVL